MEGCAGQRFVLQKDHWVFHKGNYPFSLQRKKVFFLRIRMAVFYRVWQPHFNATNSLLNCYLQRYSACGSMALQMNGKIGDSNRKPGGISRPHFVTLLFIKTG